METKDSSKAASRARHAPENVPGRSKKYRHAAVGYFIYGLIYFAGAVYLSSRDQAPQEGLIWFALGGMMVLIIPVFIWKEFKWITRLLSLFVAVRVLGVLRLVGSGEGDPIEAPWGGEVTVQMGAIAFLIVAAAECYLLIRAGWDL